MKRNDVPILLATAAYSFLFFRQTAGFNYLLFTLILTGLLLLRDSSLLRSRIFLAAAAGSIVSSFFVFWYDTTLPHAANMISLVLLAGVSMDRESSFIIAWLHSLYSAIGAVIFLMIDTTVGLTSAQADTGRTNALNKAVLAIIPIIIFIVFFFIYRASNPIFDQFAAKINFDWFSMQWVFFTIGGFILMYAFFKQRVIQYFQQLDHETTDDLMTITEESYTKYSITSAANLAYTGILLFILLNALLAIVNGLDIYYLGVLHTIPAGITYSQYLHNGTNALIASIILAVAVILFYFRGYLNFYKNNGWLKILAYTWIAQNIMLVLSTCYRNTVYIGYYGLTYKRIGVFVYLTLCIIGLITTFIKINRQKNNWFLFRKNAWITYAMMIVACAVDWDTVITDFNISRSQYARTIEIDQRYLADLGHTNFAQLFQYYIVEDKTMTTMQDPNYAESTEVAVNGRQNVRNEEIKNILWNRYTYLEREYAPHHWQSHCVSTSNNLHAVEKMIKQHHLTSPIPQP